MTNLVSIPSAGDSVPLGIAEWLACLAFTILLVNQAMSFFRHIKDKPSGSEVRSEAAEKFVSKGACQAAMAAMAGQCQSATAGVVERITFLDGQRVTDAKDGASSRSRIYDEMKSLQKSTMTEIAAVRVDMGEMERRLNKADEERTGHLHDRLNELLTDIGEMRGEIRNIPSRRQNDEKAK